ncbi:MAG: hypothetical protein R3C44_22860 [Chloroflexota bacterium]
MIGGTLTNLVNFFNPGDLLGGGVSSIGHSLLSVRQSNLAANYVTFDATTTD